MSKRSIVFLVLAAQVWARNKFKWPENRDRVLTVR